MKTFLFCVILSLTINLKAIAQNSESDSVQVRVSYFNAAQNNNKTRLNWKVVCYLSYANFEIQRSTNGVDYTTINTFSADKIRCQSPFDFDDQSRSSRTFYRLKVGDKDGNYSASKVVVAFGKDVSFEINSILPSLVTSNVLLSISSAAADKANVFITNQQGMVVRSFSTNLTKGATELRLNCSDLAKGMYVVTVKNSNLESRVVRILKM